MKGWRKFLVAILGVVLLSILAYFDKCTGVAAGAVSGICATFMGSNAYEHKKEVE